MKISPRWQCVLWLSALSLLAGLLPRGLEALAWQRDAIADGQWGRILTAHLVHLGPTHLLFNLLGLAVIAELLLEGWRWQDLLSLMLASAVGTSLFLWVGEPELRWYAGMSGALHGMWAGAALAGWLRSRQWLAAGALVALGVKLLALNGGSGAMPVVPVAHVYGAAAGLLWALIRTAPFPRASRFD